jgi:hypothetical protein
MNFGKAKNKPFSSEYLWQWTLTHKGIPHPFDCVQHGLESMNGSTNWKQCV